MSFCKFLNMAMDKKNRAAQLSQIISRLARRRLAELFIAEYQLEHANDAHPISRQAKVFGSGQAEPDSIKDFFRRVSDELDEDQ